MTLRPSATGCAGVRLMSPDIAARFWAKVDRSRGPDGCWPWLGAGSAYGLFRIDGRYRKAHRFAWELAHNRIMPEHLEACHTCDFKRCVNPAHVYDGTPADNRLDYVRRGRRYVDPAVRARYAKAKAANPWLPSYERWLINNPGLRDSLARAVAARNAATAPLPVVVRDDKRFYERTVGDPHGVEQVEGRCWASLPGTSTANGGNRQCRRKAAIEGLCWQHFDLVQR